jgi:uncharacterized membrane protein
VPALFAAMLLIAQGCRGGSAPAGGGGPADPGAGGAVDPGGGGAVVGGGTGGGSGGGGGDPVSLDRDGDGIPNVQDGFPDDPARFGDYATLLLGNLPGGSFGAAVAVNGADEIVGLSDDGVAVKAVRWTLSGGGAPTVLDPIAGDAYSAAYAVDDAGTAVGESQKGGQLVPVAWTAGSSAPAELSLAGVAAPAAAYGMGDGMIVGEATVAGETVAVLWRGAGAAPVVLGTLGGATSSAYALSNGRVVGESLTAGGTTRGALWSLDAAGAPGAPRALDPLAGHVASVALGVNAAGVIVGESESPSGEVHAVVWALDGAGLPGAPLDLGPGSASAVNDEHRVTGHRGAPELPSLWDTRNPALADPFLAGTFPVGQAYGLNGSGVVVGSADGRPFVTVPR